MGRADLISDEYREMQRALHENPAYGVASLHYAPLVAQIMESVGAEELLDYGAGKGRLGVALQEALQRPLTIHHYEPAMPQWSASPQPCRFVACLDVLEHIEPALLDTVLDDLMRVTAQIGVFSVDTAPAQKVLPDGRNAHLIQQPFEWWLPKLKARFDILSVNPMGRSFWVVVGRKRPWWAKLLARLAGERGLRSLA
jgi:hypothetical protein